MFQLARSEPGESDSVEMLYYSLYQKWICTSGWYRTLAKVLTFLGLPIFVGYGLNNTSRVVLRL